MNLKINIPCLVLWLCSFHSMVYGNQEINNEQIRARDLYFKGISLAQNYFYQEAIDSFKVALRLREKINGEKSYATGVVHNALGINYKNIGNLDKSIEHYLLAESAYLNVEDVTEQTIARLYGNIGNAYKVKMNFETALVYFQRAIDVYKKSRVDNKEDVAEIYYNIAEVYYRQNKYQDVIEIAVQYSSAAYSDTKLYFLSLEAASLKELNKINQARETYRKLIDYAHDFYPHGDLNLAFEYLNYLNFLISVSDFEESWKVLNEIKQILSENNISHGLTYALFQKAMGTFFEYKKVESNDIKKFQVQKTSNLEQAIEHYKHSFNALKMSENDSLPVENTFSITQSLTLLKSIADAYAQISDINFSAPLSEKLIRINKAIEYYNQTSQAIQLARKSMYSDEDKIILSELEEGTFGKMVQTAYKAYEMDPNSNIIEFAFLNAERRRASVVFDKLSEQFARDNSLIPDSLTDLERNLNYSITNLNEKLFNLHREEKKNEKEIMDTDSLLFVYKKKRDELNHYLEKNYSDYYEMKYANSMIEVPEVQNKLKNNEVLIEYVLNETDTIPEIYAFLFSNTHTGFYKLQADSSVLTSLETTFRFVSNPAYLFTRNNHSVEYCISSYNLYNMLIKPFEGFINNKKLIIVPDGKLSYLPFEALLTDMPDTTGLIQFNSLPYLIRNHTINYSYSANLLFKFSRQKKMAQNRLATFAPLYNSDTVQFNDEKLILLPLPGTQRETDIIAEEIRSSLFKGEEATEKNFRKESINHDILHLAMHAFINDSLPAFSRFAFAQTGEGSPENDGWLNTADIYNLNTNARLTVLSACNTGRGSLKKGEGLMSLARGFLYAGCPSIIMSLWEVEDNAGTEIMQSFYQVLAKGRNIDDALRQAKLNYLEKANPRLAHPHYWLGYVSIGSSAPLFRSYDYYFFAVLILALAGVIADQIFHLRKSGKRRF